MSRHIYIKRIISIGIILAFLSNFFVLPQVSAQGVNDLPAPGRMVNLSAAFDPVLIKGLKIHPENPFAFDFIIDGGNTNLQASDPQLKEESNKLIKYFLAAMTIPEKDLWVNLSPYEKNRILSPNLGMTGMGRDMLAQDYILKQLTSSLIYPENNLGKTFWNEVYSKAQKVYGTTQVPINTFNKVWIVADRADVFERINAAYVVGAHLKVMLEEDYFATGKHHDTKAANISSEIVRDIILPKIEKEVNQGQNFAPLRQIFYSMILASWYKQALKNTLLTQIYGDKSKVKVGINQQDTTANEAIFNRYLKAYKKGVFNYIKDEINQTTQQPISRKYFSGGENFAVLAQGIRRFITIDRSQAGKLESKKNFVVMVNASPAMIAANVRLFPYKKTVEDAVWQGHVSLTNENGEGEDLDRQIIYIEKMLQRRYGHYLHKVRQYEYNAYKRDDQIDKVDNNGISLSRAWTVPHQMAVAVRAYNIASNIHGLTEDERLKITFAAAVHDAGKTKINYKILNYPGKFNKEMRDKMKLHVEFGVKVLKKLGIPQEIIDMVAEHHQLLDGSGYGYPAAKARAEISIGGRILVVADVYTALIERRPYKKVFTIREAMSFLNSNKGTKYDIKAVNALQRYISSIYRDTFPFQRSGHIIMQKVRANAAMTTNGGIDLNALKMRMNVSTEGRGIKMQFDPAMIDLIKKQGFDGLVFNIKAIAPVTNLRLLLGIKSGDE